MPVPASSLDTYEKCPRRYLYQYGYQLYDDVSPYLRMHQAIRDAVAELTLLARDGALPPDRQALDDLLWRIFARRELEDVLYARDYFHEALGHVRQVWNDLRAGAIPVADVDRTFVLQRPTGAIAVHVDRIEQAPTGPRWIRVKSGRAGTDDHLDTRIMLYTLAYNQAYGSPGHPAIALHYTATGDTRSASPRPDVLERHTEKIDALLAGIVAGRWQPKPGQQCATCPFNLICPV